MSHSSGGLGQVLIPEEFEQWKNECNLLLKALRNEFERVNFHRTDYSVPKSLWKEMIMFETTYLELKEWLNRMRSMIQRRENTSLSRCQSYLSQDYLIALTARETDLNRLRTLGTTLKHPQSYQASDDSNMSRLSPLPYERIANELQEIELLWEITTTELAKQSYQCNYERTIRHVELDIQEAEAKLRSVQRRTFQLQPLLTGQKPLTPIDLASAMRDLKVQHADLKHTMHILNMVNDLLTRLFQCAADPVVRSVTEMMSTVPLPIHLVRDATRLHELGVHVRILSEACHETWLCQLELRERSKLNFQNLAFRNNLSQLSQKPSPQVRRLSVSEIHPSVNEARVQVSPGLPLLNSCFTSSPNIRPRSACGPAQSTVSLPAPETRSLDARVPTDGSFNMPSMSDASSTSSLVCKESGFGSDSDRAPSSPSPGISLPNYSWMPQIPAVLNKDTSCPHTEPTRGSRDQRANKKPTMRALSLDCLWYSDMAISDDALGSEDYYTALDHTPTKLGRCQQLYHQSVHERSHTCDPDPTRAKWKQTSWHILVEPPTQRLSSVKGDLGNQFAQDLVKCSSSSVVLASPKDSIHPTMPIAVCSPMNSRPLPQYASSPTTHHQQPSGKQISLSALMGNRDDADGLDLYGVAPLDEVDDTTFSELVPSITEPNTSSPVSSPLGSKRPVQDLSNPDRNELASAATESPDDAENMLQNCHDGPSELCACSFRSHAPQSLDAVNDGLEWDDSGDLRGLRPKSGSLSSGFGRYSLPLVSGGGSYRGAGTGIRNCSEATSLSGMEPIPPDKPRRSSFTLAAAAAEALVSARGRYGARRLSSSSIGNKLTSSRFTDKAPLGSSPTQRESPSNTLSSKKTRRPPVCSSTPAQRATNGHINHERHVDSETRLPTSSESPTIPAQRIRITPAPTIVTDTTTAFNKTSFDRPSRLVTSESTETMHSLFSNAPVNGVTSQTGTSRSFGDLTGPIAESAYLSAQLANQKWEECLENPLVQLGLIRSRDAAPLLGLLDRLEQGFPQCIKQSELTNTARATRDTSVQELEEERIQLDIDRSFLQFYKKELNSWKELADEYRQAVAGSPCGPQASTVLHMDQTQLAIDAFVDWLSVLQNRITVCLNHLNRRALWIDQLNGFTHELKSSFVVLEERVRNSLQRTRDMLIAWRERQNRISSPGRQVWPSSGNRPMEEPDIPMDRTQLIEALDDLQNFSDGVLTFQVRLGSCHLVNDCWSSKDLLRPVPCMLRELERPEASVPHLEDYRLTPGNTSFSSSFSSFLDPGVDTESSCTESTHLHAVTERAERLQRRLRVAIRRLERAIIAPTNSSLSVVKEFTSKGDQPATLSVSSTPIPSDATLSTEPTYPLTPSLPQSDPNCWFISRRFSFQILSLMFLCFVFVCTHHFANTTSFFTDWLARFRYPFCPHRPGSVVVDFSPNWWVRQLACLQLPSSKDITL